MQQNSVANWNCRGNVGWQNVINQTRLTRTLSQKVMGLVVTASGQDLTFKSHLKREIPSSPRLH